MTARNHHYLPKCYLRGFSTERKRRIRKTFAIDLAEGRGFETSTDNIGSRRDFNRIDGTHHPPDALELAMATLESDLALALIKLEKEKSLSDRNSRELILNLIGLVAMRNPRQRETVRRFMEDIYNAQLDLLTATPDRWERTMQRMRNDGEIESESDVSYEEVREFLERRDYDISVSREYQIGLEFDTFDTVLATLARRNWCLLVYEGRHTGFITSDHPVCLQWSEPKMQTGLYGPGFGLRGTEVLFPVSSSLALLGAFEIQEDVVRANDHTAALMNAAIASHSERQVYCRSLDFMYWSQKTGTIRKGSRLADDASFRKKPTKT